MQGELGDDSKGYYRHRRGNLEQVQEHRLLASMQREEPERRRRGGLKIIRHGGDYIGVHGGHGNRGWEMPFPEGGGEKQAEAQNLRRRDGQNDEGR